MIDLLHSSKCIQLLYEIVLFSLRFQASIVTDDTSILYRANCIAFTRFYPFIDIVFLAIFSIQVVFVRFIHFSYSFTRPAEWVLITVSPPPHILLSRPDWCPRDCNLFIVKLKGIPCLLSIALKSNSFSLVFFTFSRIAKLYEMVDVIK